MKKGFKPRELTLLGLMTAVLLVMSYTPLGYLNIGPMAVTLNMIPVAVCAVALGPAGGAITGTVFGITSLLQCLGIGGYSPMGATLFSIDPLFTVIMCIVPRFLAGLLTGYVFLAVKTLAGRTAAAFAAGFSAAFLNTVLFMASLVLLFGHTEYLQEMMNGQSVLLFVCTFVGFNAVVEVLVSTVITGLLGKALERAKFMDR